MLRYAPFLQSDPHIHAVAVLLLVDGVAHQAFESSARVDGATAWTSFWRIQLPLILQTVGIVAILTHTGAMNAFDLIFALQGPLAAPNYATDVLGTLFYRTYFGNMGVGATPFMGSTIGRCEFPYCVDRSARVSDYVAAAHHNIRALTCVARWIASSRTFY